MKGPGFFSKFPENTQMASVSYGGKFPPPPSKRRSAKADAALCTAIPCYPMRPPRSGQA